MVFFIAASLLVFHKTHDAIPIREGLTTKYYLTGAKRMEVRYRNWQRHGLCTTWHKNGEKKWVMDFDNGAYGDGTWCEWYPDGGKHVEMTYENNKLNGPMRVWDENGRPVREWYYKDDMLDGACREYHETTGALKAIHEYRDEVPHGRVASYFKAGTLEFEGHYRNGVAMGPFRFWEENGSLSKVDYRLEGEEVTRQEYLAACAKDPTLPKPPEEDLGKPHPTPDAEPKDVGKEKMIEGAGDEE